MQDPGGGVGFGGSSVDVGGEGGGVGGFPVLLGE